MRRFFRGRCRMLFAAAAVMAVLLFADAGKVWAGEGLDDTEYQASKINSEAKNIKFTGGDTILWLDEDMERESLDCDADLTIENQGSTTNTLTLTCEGPGNMLRAGGDLHLKGINLRIVQKDPSAGRAIVGCNITIEDCSVEIISGTKIEVISASGFLALQNCNSFKVKAPDGSGSISAGSEVMIRDSKLDLESVHGIGTAPGGAVSLENVSGSIHAVNGHGISSENIYLASCNLTIQAVGYGITDYDSSASAITVADSTLNVKANYGIDTAGFAGFFGSTIQIQAVRNALSAASVDLQETTGTIVSTDPSSFGICGDSVHLEICDLTVKSTWIPLMANPGALTLSQSDYIKSPAEYTITKQTIGGVDREFLTDPKGAKILEVVIARKRVSDPSCTVSAIPDQTYTGAALKPAVTLKWKGTAMEANTDYTIDSYANNTNAGTGTVKISGKGYYTGTVSRSFKIKPASITAASAGPIADQTYTGAEIKPAPVLTFNGKTLKVGTDYTLSYSKNKAVGTGTVTVTGKGNFTGSRALSFRIVEKKQTSPVSPVKPETNGKAKDGTDVGKGAELAVADKAIKAMKKDEAPAGSRFGLLQLKAVSTKKTSVKISWKKISGAKKYIVYGNACGKKNQMKKLKTTTKRSVTFKKVAGKKVKTNKYYKFLVVAVDKDSKVISTSKSVHIAAKGNKYGNDKKVKTAADKKKKKITLKKGKTFKLKAKPVPASKKLKVSRHRGIACETSDSTVATVSKKGVIKAKKKKGSCYIYAYAQNGVCTKIKVTVK